MSLCKINHSDPECIPLMLCRQCNPPKRKTPEQIAAIALAEEDAKLEAAAAETEKAERHERRKRRKLRAELKRLNEQKQKIGARDPVATARLDTAIEAAQRELYLVS